MTQIIITIISAIISGILATIITLWWQNRVEKLKTRKEIFKTLMAYRYKISHPENVKALNCVQAVFYDCKGVRRAWKNFMDAVDAKPVNGERISDAQITIIEEIAKVLKYKNIGWKDIKEFYFPEGLSKAMKQEELLRELTLRSFNGNYNNDETSTSDVIEK